MSYGIKHELKANMRITKRSNIFHCGRLGCYKERTNDSSDPSKNANDAASPRQLVWYPEPSYKNYTHAVVISPVCIVAYFYRKGLVPD